MILQRTLAALAAAGIFGASVGCLWAYADELPAEGDQLPDTVYATAGNEDSTDGAVIYSMDSSNYTEGYKINLKAEKDSLMSVDKIVVEGFANFEVPSDHYTYIPIFGVGDKRDDGYYIAIDYVDDLGESGQLKIGPMSQPLFSFRGYSDRLTITPSGVIVNYNTWMYSTIISSIDESRSFVCPDLSSMISHVLTISKHSSGSHQIVLTNGFDCLLSYSLSSFVLSHFAWLCDPVVLSFRSGLIDSDFPDFAAAHPGFDQVSDMRGDGLLRRHLIDKFDGRQLDMLFPMDFTRSVSVPFSGTLPSNVQSLQISCSGDVSAEVSNRPSAIPSVTSEDGLPAVFSATGKYVDFVTSNPVTAVCFSSTLVPIGIAVWRCLRGVV